jgi:hypothetical protein
VQTPAFDGQHGFIRSFRGTRGRLENLVGLFCGMDHRIIGMMEGPFSPVFLLGFFATFAFFHESSISKQKDHANLPEFRESVGNSRDSYWSDQSQRVARHRLYEWIEVSQSKAGRRAGCDSSRIQHFHP